MGQKVEFLDPLSNGYLYRPGFVKWERIKINTRLLKMATIKRRRFHFKVDQTKCFIIFLNSKVAGKYEEAYEEYILLLKLRIYLLISFTHQPAGRNISLLFLIYSIAMCALHYNG